MDERMQIRQTDPDLESLARRLLNKEIDLQPEFQRQEVWSKAKKQKLIDTILRGWAVPPVHLIVGEFFDEVLDGQQRLSAIRDFYLGEFPVDANIQPFSAQIAELNGLTYQNLPDRSRRIVDRYGLRVYQILDAHPQEAAELFYRLNQPTALTSGEQRNALYGERRNQMKALVNQMSSFGYNATNIGFSNTRLAYDDVIARSLVVLTDGSLRRKISEARISDQFRDPNPFPKDVFERLIDAIFRISQFFGVRYFKFNKASLFSILVFCCRVPNCSSAVLEKLLLLFGGSEHIGYWHDGTSSQLRDLFKDRSSSRVTDVSSVVIRDFCLAVAAKTQEPELQFRSYEEAILQRVAYSNRVGPEELGDFVVSNDWGHSI